MKPASAAPKIDFLRHARIALPLSAVLIIATTVSLLVRGLNFGIDFTGGTVVELSYAKPADLGQVRAALNDVGVEGAVAQYFGTTQDVLVRIPGKPAASMAAVSTQVLEAAQMGGRGVTMKRVEFVGPQVGKELVTDGALALLYVLLSIMAYVAFRFEYRFAIGAVMSLIHDAYITVGFFSITGMEFDLTVLAAVLTVLGYSINDTIVIFDRIRENFGKLRRATTREIINLSVNETLTRTIRTSLTVLLSLAPLLFFGGPAIHGFATALVVGVLVGVYSTVYVASWTLVLLKLERSNIVPTVRDPATPAP